MVQAPDRVGAGECAKAGASSKTPAARAVSRMSDTFNMPSSRFER
jgi:hypothetical protein